MFTKGKVLFQCIMLTTALWPAVVARNQNENDSEAWINRARRLNTKEFMVECGQVFMNSAHVKQHSYLMSHFAEEVTDLCRRLAPNDDQGTCRSTSFGSLDNSLKQAFFRQAVQHTGHTDLPIDLIASWGDAGYIISDKTNIEQDELRNDLCSEVYTSIGADFINHIPTSSIPFAGGTKVPDTFFPYKSREPERMSPPISAKEFVAESNIANNGNENNRSEPFTIVHVDKIEDNGLSVAAIIAISCAVAALIVVFFHYEARRRKEARVSRSYYGNKGIDDDGNTNVTTFSGGRNISPFRSIAKSSSRSTKGMYSSVEEVKEAINNADWDNVYKLASQIAEHDDTLSLPSLGSFKAQNRSHLGAEDQERTKTLDELAANSDWTGLAVTAALYAGETSGSAHSISYGADEPSTRRGTVSPSRSQDLEEGSASIEQMVTGLSAALNAGNWSRVSKYADLIKDEKNAGSSFDTDSHAIVSSSSSIVSSDTDNTDVSKKQTIEKLMRAGKWKGVSIMANMYEMESKSKQRSSSTSMRPYPTSPSHPYTDRRSIVRTKELQHEDRVEENIVSFRRDP